MIHQDWDNSIVVISCKLLWYIVIGQSIMEILLWSFVLWDLFLLPKSDLFVEFLSVNLCHVLDHDCNILGVERTLIFSIIWGIFKNDSLAQEVSGRGIQNILSLLESFLIIEFISNYHTNATYHQFRTSLSCFRSPTHKVSVHSSSLILVFKNNLWWIMMPLF